MDDLISNSINTYYQGGYIHIEKCEPGDIVFVYDLTGKVIHNETIQNINHQIKIENGGIFLVKVYSKAQTHTPNIYASSGLSISYSQYRSLNMHPSRASVYLN